MRFPPPIRITAPLLALVFGLVVTWFDYRLNLDLDFARHLAEVRESADANGHRLARLSERLFAMGQREALLADVQAMADLPTLEIFRLDLAQIGETMLALDDRQLNHLNRNSAMPMTY